MEMKTSSKIKLERKRAGMTQAELAEKLNVTPQVISQYERGIKNPKFETRIKIARALNISVLELLDTESGKSYVEEFGTPEEKQQLALREAIDPMFRSKSIEPKKEKESQMAVELTDTQKETNELNRELEQIKKNLELLNKKGRTEALKRIRELTELPRYKKE